MLNQTQKEQVLKFIQSLSTNSFTFRDVVRLLDLDSDDRRSLQHFLDELDAEEIIHRVQAGPLFSSGAREPGFGDTQLPSGWLWIPDSR